MAQIEAPVTKAAVSLGAGAGSSVGTQLVQAAGFWPSTAAEWMATIASAAACLYSLHLLWDFYWKKFWKPFLKKRGWVPWLVR